MADYVRTGRIFDPGSAHAEWYGQVSDYALGEQFTATLGTDAEAWLLQEGVITSAPRGSSSGGSGGSTVTLDPTILPTGVTLISATFGYVAAGGLLAFFGHLAVDPSSDAGQGNVPFLPLHLSCVSNGRWVVNNDANPNNLAINQDGADANAGLWAVATLNQVFLASVVFAGTTP